MGEHGLSCQLGFGRVARHGAVNDLIYRALSKAGIPTLKEPHGLLRSDGKRPDVINVTPRGAAAAIADDRKFQKYHAFLQDHAFNPLALETMGPINPAGLNFISDRG